MCEMDLVAGSEEEMADLHVTYPYIRPLAEIKSATASELCRYAVVHVCEGVRRLPGVKSCQQPWCMVDISGMEWLC